MANELSTQTHPVVALKSYLNANDIQQRLREMLGERASSFSNSIINVVSAKRELQQCDPTTIIKAAMVSASLDLPIDPALGFSAIVPYGNAAQFQLMYKGVIQLCIRSGQYENIHDTEVYRDEMESYNPITGEVKFRQLTEYKMRPQHNWGDVVGFYCCFRLLKGFHASLYMTKEEVMAHAERYSKAYQYDLRAKKQSCPWSTDPIAMGRKTVILALLKRYGIMSVEMQDAVVADAEDENTRQVESQTLEPTQGRVSFGATKEPPKQEEKPGVPPAESSGEASDKPKGRGKSKAKAQEPPADPPAAEETPAPAAADEGPSSEGAVAEAPSTPEAPSFPPCVCDKCGKTFEADCAGNKCGCGGKIVKNSGTWECQHGHVFAYDKIILTPLSPKGKCPICSQQGKVMLCIAPRNTQN